MTADVTEESLTKVLDGLVAVGYIVIDEGNMELLVRSFVRWDLGYNNPKRRPVILRAAAEVSSQLLRDALAAEFERLGLSVDGLNVSAAQYPISENKIGDPPHVEGQSSEDGVVVTTAGALLPHSTTHTPHPPAEPMPDEPAPTDAASEQLALIAEIRAIRPDWTTAAIAAVLTEPEILERPWPVIAAAFVLVAKDPTSTSPGRLRVTGPWWATASARASPPRTLPEPCGECGPGRMVEVTTEGRTLPARCPNCHPMYIPAPREEAS